MNYGMTIFYKEADEKGEDVFSRQFLSVEMLKCIKDRKSLIGAAGELAIRDVEEKKKCV